MPQLFSLSMYALKKYILLLTANQKEAESRDRRCNNIEVRVKVRRRIKSALARSCYGHYTEAVSFPVFCSAENVGVRRIGSSNLIDVYTAATDVVNEKIRKGEHSCWGRHAHIYILTKEVDFCNFSITDQTNDYIAIEIQAHSLN